MRIALIGWQSSGKSSLFKALTGTEPPYGEEAYQGMAEVPDSVLDNLHRLYPPAKKIAARIEYLDVAGLAHGDERSGFKRSMINHLQSANVLAAVIGTYLESEKPLDEVKQKVLRDLEDIEAELLISDLSVAEARAEKIAQMKQRGLPVDKMEMETIQKVVDHLNTDRPLRELELRKEEEKAIRSFGFLSQKPLLVIGNADEEQDCAEMEDVLREDIQSGNRYVVVVNGQLEAEIAGLDEEDRDMFLEEMGIEQPAAFRIQQAGFTLLGLIRFFTVGDDEVRAWPIPKGTPAVEAAGTIHSDLQRGFIRAEVVPSTDLLELGSLSSCRDKGLLRLEGKTYEVVDGDVMHIRFAV